MVVSLKVITQQRDRMTISSLDPTQGNRGYKYPKTERTKDTEIYYLH